MSARRLMVMVSIVTSACGGDYYPPVEAESCYVVAVEGSEERITQFDAGKELVPLFENFVSELDVRTEPERGDFYLHYRAPEIGVRFGITFATGRGEAITSLFSDNTEECPLCDEYEAFVSETIGAEYQLLQCYQPPVLYGVPLRNSGETGTVPN